jgi:hypothetical protein
MATRKKTYEQIRKSLKTGDIVLFSGKGGVSDWIKLFTSSTWSHVGMVLRLPQLDMVLLWESTTLSDLVDIETGKARKGVQLVPFSERMRMYSGDVAVRHLSQPLTSPMEKALMKFRKKASRLKYEQSKVELIKSAWDGPFGSNKENLSSVFCSELVAESYQQMGLLTEPPKGWPSNEYTPRDFSTESRQPLTLHKGYSLSREVVIRN